MGKITRQTSTVSMSAAQTRIHNPAYSRSVESTTRIPLRAPIANAGTAAASSRSEADRDADAGDRVQVVAFQLIFHPQPFGRYVILQLRAPGRGQRHAAIGGERRPWGALEHYADVEIEI